MRAPCDARISPTERLSICHYKSNKALAKYRSGRSPFRPNGCKQWWAGRKGSTQSCELKPDIVDLLRGVNVALRNGN